MSRALRTTDSPPVVRLAPESGARPGWRRALASWGMSLLLHVLAIVGLAVLLLGKDLASRPRPIGLDVRIGDPAGGDLTSLRGDDLAGDPFTTDRSEEPPSLTLDPVEATDARLMTLLPRVRLGPDVRPGGPLDRALEVEAGDEALLAKGTLVAASAPLTGRRSGPLKALLLRREGGTPQSEAAVDRGLDWLARHQRPDGSWALDTAPACSEPACPPGRSMTSDAGATGLALLAFLGAGHTHDTPGPYRGHVTRGLRWLLSHQGRDGDLFTGGDGHAHLYSHAIAAMALGEALGLSGDADLRRPTKNALGFIDRAQNRVHGGWRYVPGYDADTSVLGWQLFALRSGRFAGIAPGKNTLRLARLYLDNAAAEPRKSTYSYKPGGNATPTMTAEALLARQYLGWGPDHPALVAGTARVAANLEESTSRNIYYWYYATQLLHNMGGPAWTSWNARVRDGLIAEQVQGVGCDRGSWDPIEPQADVWGRRAGRLYQTSLSLLTLEVYYRYLPLYRTDDLDLAGAGGNEPIPDETPTVPPTSGP